MKTPRSATAPTDRDDDDAPHLAAVYDAPDDDLLYVLTENPSEALRAKVEQAVRVCPKQAITIEED